MRPRLHRMGRALAILAFAAVPLASAQTSRVAFTVTTSTDLDATDVVAKVAGDFNNDGHLDLILTTRSASTSNVKLLAGSGRGSFSHAGGFSFADASAIAAADFNGDGALDVAITQDVLSKQNSGYSDFVCGSLVGVAIFLGPTMASGRCLATVPRGVAVKSGDFDGDDRPDLAVVSASGHGLVVYSELNFVTHTVKVTNVVDGRLSATSMAPPVDVNRDGILDLVIGHAAGVRVLLGNGDGTFRIGGSAGSTNGTQAVAAGDLNEDGVLDVASVEAASGRLHVGFGAGDGTFSTQMIATIGADLSDVAIEDLDRDGRSDVIVAHEGGGTVAIFFGNGDGTFVSNPALALSATPRSLVVRDLDEDGDLDLGIFDAGVNGLNAQLWIALQDGRGSTDTTPPIVTLTSPLAGTTVNGVAAVTAVASDDVGVIQVEFVADGQTLGSSAGPVYSVSWNTTMWPNGPATVSARALDAAHNESQWSTIQVTVNNAPASDTTPPVVTVPENAAVEATGPAGTAFSFTASATDNVDGSVAVSCEPATGSTFPFGTTTVTCAATDSQGNMGSASFTVTVSDTTPPALTGPADATVEASGPDGASVSFSASATDVVDGPVAVNCDRASGAMFPLGVTRVTCTATDSRHNAALTSFTVRVTDTTGPRVAVPADAVLEATGPAGAALTFAASASDVVDGSVAVSCDPASGATFILGTTAVACSAVDARGNRGSASFAVTVRDTTAPIVTVPASATLEATEAAGAPFIYTASATDGVDGVVAVSCSPVSGSIFVIGATTVTCTATDAHGNARSGAFAVTVTDTTAPLVAVPLDQTVEATGSAGAAFIFIVTATDRVGGTLPAGCAPASGSTFPFGPTTVTCTATDTHGNSGTAAFVVTVTDTTPPSVTVPGNATIEATASTGAIFNYAAYATDIVDAVLAVHCTVPSGSMFPIGTSLVTCTARDAHGNTGTASFTVTVNDAVTKAQSPFGGTPRPIPGITQAEEFDEGGEAVAYHDSTSDNSGGQFRATAVDVQMTADAGGGYNVGWMTAGEWLNYTVSVSQAGTYALTARVAAAGAGGTFHVEFGGLDKTGPLTIPNTGSWQAWTDVTATVTLNAGVQTMRFAADSNGPTGVFGNLNYLKVADTTTAPSEIVLYATDLLLHGAWVRASDSSAPGGQKALTPDAGWSTPSAPLATPVDYLEATFDAPTGTPYGIWLRLRATGDTKFSESVWVQFSDALANGTSVFPIGSTTGLLANLEPCRDCGVSGWGWQNGAYWLSQPTSVSFATSGRHTIRIQVREDGAQIDQIVLSPSRYLNAPPGPTRNDATIVPK